MADTDRNHREAIANLHLSLRDSDDDPGLRPACKRGSSEVSRIAKVRPRVIQTWRLKRPECGNEQDRALPDRAILARHGATVII
jgi:hypothetical protein